VDVSLVLMSTSPQVLALSVSQTGDRRPKDSDGVNHHYKMCKEIMSKETSKQILLYSTSK
jgi:guanylate kinase